MSADDLVMVSPYPSLRDPSGSTSSIAAFSGVATYSERLTTALAGEGLRVRVLAPEVDGEPTVARVGGVTVERRYRRGPTALPVAARAAGQSEAPIVHIQHETFLFGGPSSIPGVVPALAALRARRQGPVVTLHQVVDPTVVDRDFTRLHRVQVPPWAARLGLSGVQRTIRTLSAATVVHERAFARIVPGAVVVPHGIDGRDVTPTSGSPDAKEKLGLRPNRLTALCFGFLSPYKGLECALEAAALAGDSVELVVAGGTHPRMSGDGAYGDDLRRRYGDVARFTGYVAEPDVATYFEAADVLLLPYPAPFGTSGPFAQALGYGTPVLCSEALARCMDAPEALVVPVEPEGMAKRLVELATDPRALQSVGAATAELASGRTWNDVARHHVALYEEVIHARRAAGRRLRPGKSG
jgi:glycosyltransferase involved in cell wall biosynthesis